MTLWIDVCLPFTKEQEGCRLNAYFDQAGQAWTIGYGHTGDDVYYGLTWTQDQADQDLYMKLCNTWAAISPRICTPLNSYQIAAVVDFTYNVGEGAFLNSTLLKILNQGDLNAAADQFSKWIYAGGNYASPVAGLVNRRNAEQDLFLTTVDQNGERLG